jgi:hypothetical protein
MLHRESGIDEIRRELAMLQLAHEALLKSHRKLALKTLGDRPETAQLLDEIPSDIVEHFPEWMK